MADGRKKIKDRISAEGPSLIWRNAGYSSMKSTDCTIASYPTMTDPHTDRQKGDSLEGSVLDRPREELSQSLHDGVIHLYKRNKDLERRE